MNDLILLAAWIGSISLILFIIGVIADDMESFFGDFDRVQSRDDDE